MPDIEEWDEACGCEKPDIRDYDGRMLVDMGDLSMRVPFRETSHGLEINFGEKVGVAKGSHVGDFKGRISTDLLPAALRFLGEVEDGELDCAFSRHQESPQSGHVSIWDFAEASAGLVVSPRVGKMEKHQYRILGRGSGPQKVGEDE
jgi:hypothetical protein